MAKSKLRKDEATRICREKGFPLSIKEAGIDESLFQAKLGPMAESYIDNLTPAVLRVTPERRQAVGIPMTADEVRELLVHAWNGTKAEFK